MWKKKLFFIHKRYISYDTVKTKRLKHPYFGFSLSSIAQPVTDVEALRVQYYQVNARSSTTSISFIVLFFIIFHRRRRLSA